MTSILVASSRVRRAGWAVAGAGLAILLSSANGAFAQAPVVTPNCNFIQNGNINNLNSIAAPAAAVSGAIAGAIGNINTIFLGQQGSAFVSAPPNPKPDQPGGGVWGRVIGGEVTLKSSSVSQGNAVVPLAPVNNTTITTNCNNNQKSDFVGFQVGQDIARLNTNGWNLHLGTTAGYLASKSRDTFAGNDTKFEVPFWGTYLVATKDRFFADVLVRQEFYNIDFTAPTYGYQNQPIGARGVSVTASAGYNFALANNWFIEPSAGFVYSNTKVDSFNSVGSPGLLVSGTNSINDIESKLGRLSVRVGTTVQHNNIIFQPFATASVFHEFAAPVTATFSSFPNSFFFNPPGPPIAFTQTTSTSRVGTYGQFSLGVAGQVANTGWLGYARLDYRHGENIDGWTGNAGIRYQFTPEMIAAVMPRKAPVKALSPIVTAVNWSGFYVGGFAGVDYGTTDMRFVGDPFNAGAKTWAVGAIGGLQGGYNHQVNQWVFGVEGDIGWTNLRGGRACGLNTGLDATGVPLPGPAGFTPAFLTCQDRMDWVATATARVGYAYERTLYYVKGGAAFTEDRLAIGCIIDPAQNGVIPPGGGAAPRRCANQVGVTTNGFGGNSNRVGWTLGYGVEFALGNNWSAKAEYDYIDFGRKDTLMSDGTTIISAHPTQSQVKIGVNYRFVPGATVVAKY